MPTWTQIRQIRRSGVIASVVALTALNLAGCLPAGTRSESSAASTSAATDTAPSAPVAAPSGPLGRPSFVAPTPTPAPTFAVYTVVRGDSLTTVAYRFGTTARSIAFWNRSTYPSLDPDSAAYHPNLLQPGWTLFVVPNVILDEQSLPDPSVAPTASPEAGPSGPPPS